MNTVALKFNDVQFDIVDQNGEPWISARDLAKALGYADESSVGRLFKRNSDEFTNSMTSTVKLTVLGKIREIRIFSLRGCHLIAMFARTPVAKQFRIWVLDILENLGKRSKRMMDEYNQICFEEAVSQMKGSFHGRGLYNRKLEKPIYEAKIRNMQVKMQITLLDNEEGAA